MNHFHLAMTLNFFARIICGAEQRAVVKIKLITVIHLFLEEDNSINYEYSFSFTLRVMLKESSQAESMDMEGNKNI